MLVTKGDIAKLVDLAEETGSLHSLMYNLSYLNAYGDDWEFETNVEMEIFEVNKERVEVDVRVHWTKQDTWGGLNIENSTNGFTWSVRQ